MRRLPALTILLVAVLAALAVAACSSGGSGPTWTYAPAPSASGPAASGAASGAPSAGASAPASAAPSSAASAAPSAGESAAPSGGGGTTLNITAPSGAATSGFDPTTLEAKANTALTIHFDNQDGTAPHNVALTDPSGAAVALTGDTKFFTGPGTRDYGVPALAPGTYKYFCQVHPTTMTGTLTVK